MARLPEKQKQAPTTLLRELCGADSKLYECLSTRLYLNPTAAISQKDLDVLITEAEASGDYRLAFDKAVFEGSQCSAEPDRYVDKIQSLASKMMRAADQERQEAEQEGLADLAASRAERVEELRLVRDRTDDLLIVASKFYRERLLELGQDESREERHEDGRHAELEARKVEKRERADRETRRRARKGMGRAERREAKRTAATEEAAAQHRKEAREQERDEAQQEDRRIGQQEAESREARKEGRRGD